MWSKEVTASELASKFPKSIVFACSPTDTIISVWKEYGVRVHFDRNTRMYSYQLQFQKNQRFKMVEIEKSFLTPSLSVDHDSDGNVIITQLGKDVYLTPRQCLELVEVLKVVREVTGENK